MAEIRGLGSSDAERQRLFERWIYAASSHRPFQFTANERLNWTPVNKPLAECQVALVCTAGVQLKSQPPFDMYAEAGDWSCYEIPDDTPPDGFQVNHAHYDRTAAQHDINCLFPLHRLHELVASGEVGSTSPVHFGLMGYVPNPRPLIEETIPKLVRRVVEMGNDAALLVPG